MLASTCVLGTMRGWIPDVPCFLACERRDLSACGTEPHELLGNIYETTNPPVLLVILFTASCGGAACGDLWLPGLPGLL